MSSTAKKSKRTTIWMTSSGTKTAVECIAEVLTTHIAVLLVSGGLRYTSNDMKSGMDIPLLITHAKLLSELISLDPRGGFFGQKNMDAAFKYTTAQEKFKTSFEAWCAKNPDGPTTTDRGCLEASYACRVMLAHGQKKMRLYHHQ